MSEGATNNQAASTQDNSAPASTRAPFFNAAALLALFVRSLREDTRSRSMLWTRIGLSLSVLLSVWMTHSKNRLMGSAAGLAFFESVVWINFTFITIAGLSYFATPITEEKEEDTLGLLRMTDLSPFAILLGKSTSRFIGGAFLLAVQFPFSLLAITLGGIRLDQVAGAYMLLCAYMFFACNVGLLASVIARRAGGAAVWACILGFFWAVWPAPLIASLGHSMESFLVVASFDRLLATAGTTADIQTSLVWLLAGGVVAFAIARWKFDAFCDEGGETLSPTPVFTAADSSTAPNPGSASFRTEPRRPWDTGLPWSKDTVAWRDYHFIHGGARAAWVKTGLYLLGTMTLLAIAGDSGGLLRSSTLVAFSIFFGSVAILFFECVFAASRNYRIERKERTLSSLYILPNDVPELMRSKRRAIMLSLIPVLFFVGLGAVLVVSQFAENLGGAGEPVFWIAQGVAYFIALLFFNVRFVSWLSLRMKWGALPVALSISWMANIIVVPLAFLMFRQAFLFMLTCGAAVAAAIMNSGLRERIAVAATEE